MTQLITLNPEPPIQGQSVVVCYTFESGGDAVSITVSFSPGGPTTTHTVDPANPCVTLTAPEDATSITVVDSSGTSPDKLAPVDPG